MKIIDRCPICGKKGVLIHKGVRDNKDINVYKCTFCETKYLDKNIVMDYSNDEMLNDKVKSNEDIIKWLDNCYIDDYRRFKMVSDICESKKVLDFGCGFGGFLNLIKQNASLIEGVELGKIERQYLASKNITTYDDIRKCNKQYDVITLFHCFEHLDEPQKWLDLLWDYLEEEGYLVIEVPNGNDALLELYNCKQFEDFTYWSAHLNLFTSKSLEMLINSTNKYSIFIKTQLQRYSLANSLFWLSDGKPGGQNVYKMFNEKRINEEYTKILRENDMCDTLFYVLRKRKQ